MAVMRVTSAQQAPTPPADPQAAARDQFRQQIQQTIRDAQQAARDAQTAGRDAARHGPYGVIVGPGAPIPSIPGHTVVPGFEDNSNLIPPQAVDIAISFFVMCAVIVVGWPLARAFGRRIERRGDTTAIGPGVVDQLQRIEHAVDAMSIEIERISESQRFMAKLQNAAGAERIALPRDGR